MAKKKVIWDPTPEEETVPESDTIDNYGNPLVNIHDSAGYGGAATAADTMQELPPPVPIEPVSAVKRTRRTAVQMFADEKQARMDEIAALENSITFKQAQLELAKTGLETFIADTKAALGF